MKKEDENKRGFESETFEMNIYSFKLNLLKFNSVTIPETNFGKTFFSDFQLLKNKK